MKPLLRTVVAICLLLGTHAHPENIEEVKELPQSKEPVVEAEESGPQARVERCSTCSGTVNLGFAKSPKEIVAALQSLPAGEVHTQQSFEGCSSSKGCAGIKLQDGQVTQKFGNLNAFGGDNAINAASAFGSNLLNGKTSAEPFWWMGANSPFKKTHSASYTSKSSSYTSSGAATGGFGAVDISKNAFLNPGSLNGQASFESSSYEANKQLDVANNPFLNGNINLGQGFQGTRDVAAGQNANAFANAFGSSSFSGSAANDFAGAGYIGSSPAPFATTGSNVNLIQTAQKDFDFGQAQQTIGDDIFAGSTNAQGLGVQEGLQQTCAGQGYACVLKTQCIGGAVSAASVPLARIQKQYCNSITETCCRLVAPGVAQNTAGLGFGAESQGSGVISNTAAYDASQSTLGFGSTVPVVPAVPAVTAVTSGSAGSFGGVSSPAGLGSTGYGSTIRPVTGLETDSFSSQSENNNVFRPGSFGGLKPGIPYLPPVDNTNSDTNIVSSTAFPSTFVTTPRPVFTPRPVSTPRPILTPRPVVTARPFTTARPTYLPPVSSTSAPGYLPPVGEQSINRETFVPSPSYTDGGIILDETRSTTRQPIVPILNKIPAGCAAALKCTPIEFCTSDGIISNTTVVLTREQDAYRVPLTDCKDVETGRIGKCCRDPYYTDPWPANQIGQWVPGAFGNDGKYVPDSTGSGTTQQVTGTPFGSGSTLLNIFRETTTPTYTAQGGQTNIKTVGVGQYDRGGIGKVTQTGIGQYGKVGVGQRGQVGVGQIGQVGVSQKGQVGIGQTGQVGIGQRGQVGIGQIGQTGSQRGQVGVGQRGQVGVGQTGQVGVGQVGQFGIGQVGQIGFGQRGQVGVGQRGQIGVGQTGQVGVGQVGQAGIGQRGQVGVGQIGVGQRGESEVGQIGHFGVGQRGEVGVGQIGQFGVGQAGQVGFGQRGQIGVGQRGQIGVGQTGQFGVGQIGQVGVGQRGQVGVGQVGQVGLGQRGQVGVGQREQIGVGQIGQVGLGQREQVGVGQTGQVGLGQIGQVGIGQRGQVGVGEVGQVGVGQRGQVGVGQIGQFGVGQRGEAGIGQIGQFGVGQRGEVGVGQRGEVGVGQIGGVGVGQYGQVGVGEIGQVGVGQIGQVGVGQRGQVGVGLIGQRGSGIGQFGAGAIGDQGQGQIITQEGGFGIRQKQGTIVNQGTGELIGVGVGTRNKLGQVSQGITQVVEKGEGQYTEQGTGQAIITGSGVGIKKGVGLAISQGAGIIDNESSASTHRIFLQRYDGSGQCGIKHPQKPYGNRENQEVDFAEIPWQAMVLLQTNKSLLCGGVITRPDVVITSAACVDGLEAKNVLIKGGEWKLGIDEEPLPFQIVQVKTIVFHPGYKPGSLKDDVAILHLTENLRLANNIQPICLPDSKDSIDAFYGGAGECIVTGWGKIVLQAHLLGSIMHSVNMSLIEPNECESRLQQDYPHLLDNYDQESCACGAPSNPLSNVCRVDIGSALACTTGDGHFVLQGIYSWDSGCQTTNQLAAFYKFDIEWYEWAIGLTESVRFEQYVRGTKVTTTKYTGQTFGQGQIVQFGKGQSITTGQGQIGTGAIFSQGQTGKGQIITTGQGQIGTGAIFSQGQTGKGQIITTGQGQIGTGAIFGQGQVGKGEIITTGQGQIGTGTIFGQGQVEKGQIITTGQGQIGKFGVGQFGSSSIFGQSQKEKGSAITTGQDQTGTGEAQYSDGEINASSIFKKGTGIGQFGSASIFGKGQISNGQIGSTSIFGQGQLEKGQTITTGEGQIGSIFGKGQITSANYSQLIGTGSLDKFTKLSEGGLNLGSDIKGPISNTFSATYTEKKFFQTEPKFITYTTKPEIITYTTKPEIVTYTTKPEIVTFTTKPEIFTYTTKPKIITYTTKPKIITYTTKPKFITYTTRPQIVTYETSGSGTNPQYAAPEVTFNPSFPEIVGHQHTAHCKCAEGKK